MQIKYRYLAAEKRKNEFRLYLKGAIRNLTVKFTLQCTGHASTEYKFKRTGETKKRAIKVVCRSKFFKK